MTHDETSDSAQAEIERIRRVAAQITPEDQALTPPPADIWPAIEAVVDPDGSVDPSIIATHPRTPPVRTRDGMVVEYWIDADDQLTDVGAGWDEFALANFAPVLATPRSATSLWSQMDRQEIRELWQLIVRRAREHQAPLQATFRCDAPHARRWFEMTVTPNPAKGVHFESRLLFEEERSRVALLDPTTARDSDLPAIEVCSWCGRGRHDGRWIDIEQLVATARLLERDTFPPVSHGLCATCREDMAAEFSTSAEQR